MAENTTCNTPFRRMRVKPSAGTNPLYNTGLVRYKVLIKQETKSNANTLKVDTPCERHLVGRRLVYGVLVSAVVILTLFIIFKPRLCFALSAREAFMSNQVATRDAHSKF